MKRWLILLLTASMLFSLCACKRAQEPTTPTDVTPPDVTEPQPQPEDPNPVGPEDPQPEQPAYTMYVYTADGSGSFAVSEESVETRSPATLIGALARAGVALLGAESRGANLEDYFLKLIGGGVRHA